jgi:hypothetical protein
VIATEGIGVAGVAGVAGAFAAVGDSAAGMADDGAVTSLDGEQAATPSERTIRLRRMGIERWDVVSPALVSEPFGNHAPTRDSTFHIGTSLAVNDKEVVHRG